MVVGSPTRHRKVRGQPLRTKTGMKPYSRGRIAVKLGAWLHDIRVGDKLTKQKIAKGVNIRPSDVVSIENGNDMRVLSLRFLMRYAAAMGYVISIGAIPVGSRIKRESRFMVRFD